MLCRFSAEVVRAAVQGRERETRCSSVALSLSSHLAPSLKDSAAMAPHQLLIDTVYMRPVIAELMKDVVSLEVNYSSSKLTDPGA